MFNVQKKWSFSIFLSAGYGAASGSIAMTGEEEERERERRGER